MDILPTMTKAILLLSKKLCNLAPIIGRALNQPNNQPSRSMRMRLLSRKFLQRIKVCIVLQLARYSLGDIQSLRCLDGAGSEIENSPSTSAREFDLCCIAHAAGSGSATPDELAVGKVCRGDSHPASTSSYISTQPVIFGLFIG